MPIIGDAAVTRLVTRSCIVLFERSRARAASACAHRMCLANALGVGEALDAVEQLGAEPLNACWRDMLARLSQRWKARAGRGRASAKTSITAATGTSHQAMKAKIASGVRAETQSCGRYWSEEGLAAARRRRRPRA